MKKIKALFLILALSLLTLVSCTEAEAPYNGTDTAAASDTKNDTAVTDSADKKETDSDTLEKETEAHETETVQIPVSPASYEVKTPFTYPRYEEAGYEYFGAQHIQGACVDDELRYMYFSLTGIIVKVDMATGEEAGKFIASRELQGKGFHMGNIAYHDGKLYIASTFWGSPKTYIAVLSDSDLVGTVDETKADFKPENTILKGFLTPNCLDENKLSESGDFRYQSGGHDGITVGNIPGKGYILPDGTEVNDDKKYLLVSLATSLTDVLRYDDDNKQIAAYDFDAMTDDKLLPLTLERINSEESDNALPFSYRMFVYTGDHRYGTQVICADKDTGDILIFSYGRAEANEFPKETTFVIDGSKKLYIDEIEVGQSVSKTSDDYNIARIKAYEYTDTDDIDRDGDTDEFPTGYHMTLKCICGKGDIEKHTKASYGETGKEIHFCGGAFGSSNGVISVGGGYFYIVKAADNIPLDADGNPKKYSSRDAEIKEYGAKGVLCKLATNGKWDFITVG